jgi:hypothetical protein
MSESGTSWSDLLGVIRAKLAAGNPAVGMVRTPDGGQVQYRTIDELIKLEAWVAAQAEAETARPGSRRANAVAAGGSW